MGASGGTGSEPPRENLTPPEVAMIAGAAAGVLVDGSQGPFDVADMQVWRAERTIRAVVLRNLLVGEEWPVDARGVRIRGMRISGHLDLEGAALRCPLFLDRCYCDSDVPIRLGQATAIGMTLTGCLLPGLAAEQFAAKSLDLSRSTLTGTLRLPGADIDGLFSCRSARLTGHDDHGNALAADRMRVSGDVLLDDGFTAAGSIRVVGAAIDGLFSCRSAQLTGHDDHGNALAADRMRVSGDVLLDDGFTAAGSIRVVGAAIDGLFSCRSAQLTGHDDHGNALAADGISTGGVLLDEGFTAAGAVSLGDADIAGQLSCRSARLTGQDDHGNALAADRMRVSGDVLLDEGFTAAGSVRVVGAAIDGLFSCRSARLTGHDDEGKTLAASRLRVSGDVLLDEGFTAAGGVSLGDADIAGQLSCRGAQLGRDLSDIALAADKTTIGGDVFLDDGFTALGAISLASAQVAGSVYLIRAKLANDATALNAAEARIKGVLQWAPEDQVRGQVNLESTEVGQLDDDWSPGSRSANGFWPDGGGLRLKGFTYGAIGGTHPATASQRLDWIRSQFWPYDRTVPFTTQPYNHLATVYRQAGQDTQATLVAVAMRSDRRRFDDLSSARWFANWLWDKTIKYGYQNWRAIWTMAAIYLIVVMVSFIAQRQGLIEPVGNIAGLHPVPVATRCRANYPCFYPAGYAFDVVFPLINVHQAEFWGINGAAPWGRVLISFTWVATALGWIGASFLLAGLTSLVRRT